eukprot:908920_1
MQFEIANKSNMRLHLCSHRPYDLPVRVRQQDPPKCDHPQHQRGKVDRQKEKKLLSVQPDAEERTCAGDNAKYANREEANDSTNTEPSPVVDDSIDECDHVEYCQYEPSENSEGRQAQNHNFRCPFQIVQIDTG